MVAIIGMFFQDGLTGSAWGDWANYTDSPLRAFENDLGVQAPVGFWYPLGFTKDGDVEDFQRRRATEIKHGRVCMYACIGYMVPEYYKFSGYLSPSGGLKFSDVPNGLAALKKVPTEGWLQIIAFCGFYELVWNVPTDEPGNFGKGWLGITGKSVEDPEKRKRSLNAELANGRLAMVAIMGMMFQNGTVGYSTGPEMWLGGSAFENELGVQAPAGFWDPIGLSSDGDSQTFARRRAAELKHGRICMYVCIGYIVPEYFRFGGELSPSQGLSFSDVPNGLGAFSVVPAAGWVQILAFCGLIEVTGFFQGRKNIGFMRDSTQGSEPGNYGLGTFGAFNKIGTDPAVRTRRLNAELANGRLAMIAIMGLLFQNGTVGNTGSEMYNLPPGEIWAGIFGLFLTFWGFFFVKFDKK